MCPICKHALIYKNYSDEWCVIESLVRCSYCDYYEHEVYGNCTIAFGEHVWTWTHDATDDETIIINIEVAALARNSKPSFKNRVFHYYPDTTF